MRKLVLAVFVGSLGLTLIQQAQAQSLPDMLKGRWVFEGGDCTAGITFQLSGDVLRVTNAAGHVATERVTERRPAEPFVPGSLGDYKLTDIHVDVPPVPDGAEHAPARVSFDNLGKPATVSVVLDRTPAGWRIADVSPTPGQSFRGGMAACVAVPK